MTLESEFLEMPPETYEETLRVFARIAATSAQALGKPIPEESQEIFDAPDGSLAAAKRAADSARVRATQTPTPEPGVAELDEQKRDLTLQRARQGAQEAVAQVLHLNIDDVVVRPQAPPDAIHSFEVWPLTGDPGDDVDRSDDEEAQFAPFLSHGMPSSIRRAGAAPFIVHSFEYGDLSEFVLIDHHSTSKDERSTVIVEREDGKYIVLKQAETDTDKELENTADAFSRAQKSSTAKPPTTTG